MSPGNKLVYSSGPRGNTTPSRAATPRVVPRPIAVHDLRVRRETSGRGGKQVTVAAPLFLAEADAKALLKQLKQAAGSGGTLREIEAGGEAAFAFELQGDKVDAMLRELSARGFRGKRAGG